MRDENIVVVEQKIGSKSRRRSSEGTDGRVDSAEIDLFREVDPGDGLDR
jgi:hypothetical protein